MTLAKITLFMLFSIQGYTLHAQIISAFKPYQWKKRVVLVFSTSDQVEMYQKQWAVFKENNSGMQERDLLVVGITNENVNSPTQTGANLNTAHEFREYYKINKGEFAVILIGKDGGEKLRENQLVTSEQLFSLVDSMPMRQQEMRDNPKYEKNSSY